MTTNPVNVTAGSIRHLTAGPSAGRWQATLILGEGRGATKRTRTFATRRDAAAWQHDTKRRGLPHGDAAAQTVAQAFDVYLSARVLRPNTVETFQAVRAHVVASGLGDVKLAKLKPSAQDQFTAWLVREGFAPSSTNMYASKLATVLRFAAADGGLGFTPKAVTVTQRRTEVPAMTVADVAALYAAAPDDFAPVILLGAFCGLRASEACAVTVGDVDWNVGSVRVSKAVDADGRHDRTKTERSLRTVPVPANVLAELEPQRFRSADADLARNYDGGRLTPRCFARTFRAVADDAGVDVTFHALRKFYATTQLAAGVNPKAVARYLGDSVATMLATYALVQPTDDDLARAAIAAAFGATAAA